MALYSDADTLVVVPAWSNGADGRRWLWGVAAAGGHFLGVGVGRGLSGASPEAMRGAGAGLGSPRQPCCMPTPLEPSRRTWKLALSETSRHACWTPALLEKSRRACWKPAAPPLSHSPCWNPGPPSRLPWLAPPAWKAESSSPSSSGPDLPAGRAPPASVGGGGGGEEKRNSADREKK
ncbi:hypothetical protein PR202_ga30814 [Eleusine coracana subsp. coracana]|uniref:Uncharacterized protein n=1 Tax=Eleusine coracana subsp. coracana TaxID=191504 RepID=A0AAV5DPX0_ELECO|nr:hypothetical protein PR202_ga30814 [Eleusine coracana subsp. coracana]